MLFLDLVEARVLSSQQLQDMKRPLAAEHFPDPVHSIEHSIPASSSDSAIGGSVS
jgi:hypothetical protein